MDTVSAPKPKSKKARKPPIPALPGAVSLSALMEKRLPPAVPRIWPWLDSGESCLLWGGTGTGKSLVAMTLALGVAGGGSFLGWNFPNQCRVLYVDGEQSERDLQSRFGLLSQTLGSHDAKKTQENLVIHARTLGAPGVPFFDLNSTALVGPLIETLKTQHIGFVVFDNLSTLADSLADENKSSEFKRLQAVFAQLKAANITSILVHHAGKNLAKGYRGSSSIGTTFERIVGLLHNETEPSTVLAARLEIEKYRAKPPPGFSSEVHFRLVTEETEGRTTKARWQLDEEQGHLAEAWHMFKAGDYRTVGEFVSAYNRRYGTSKGANNFSRDFARPWKEKKEWGITQALINSMLRGPGKCGSSSGFERPGRRTSKAQAQEADLAAYWAAQ